MGKKVSMILSVLAAFLFFFNASSTVRGDAEYVGSETCKGCHVDSYSGYAKSIHAKKAISGSPANREGCESCHGPGGQHVEKGGGSGVAIFAFSKKADANTRSASCLTCHEGVRALAYWGMSRHQSADVSCDNCHSMHMGRVGENLLKGKGPEACFGCHRNIKAQTNKQSHHPIREGKVKCTDCHNPHGSFDIKAMITADSLNELCYKCHAEKRGPYAFEHAPVPEDCLSCHEIHGSNHSKLLVRKVPNLCQSCHSSGSHLARGYTHLHSFGGPATSNKNRFFARSCLNCHGNIHGSNHPALGEGFVR